MTFYVDMEKSLLEAIRMEKGDISLTRKDNMPAPTYYSAEESKTTQEEKNPPA